jgi:hypothetical protein
LGVVVPLFNKEATVRRCVEALLTQTEKPRRIVVVDDGSTDGSLQALAPFRDRITVLRQPNAGPSAARNRGIYELDTEWVAFADADNCWLPDRIACIHRVVKAQPHLEWMTGCYFRCTPDASTAIMPAIPVSMESPGGAVDYFDWTASAIAGIHASETLVGRTALVRSIGGFNVSLWCHEITFMYLSLAVQRPTCGIVASPTVRIFFDGSDSLYCRLSGSATAMLAYAKALGDLSTNAGTHRGIVRSKAAEALHAALWLALNDGSLGVSREIIFSRRSDLRFKPRIKGALRYVFQAVCARLRESGFGVPTL